MKKHNGLVAQRSKYAYLFLIPWMIGILQFFIIPVFSAFIYSLSSIEMTESGFVLSFSKLTNYTYILKEDPQYTDNLIASITSYLYSMPIIISISLIISVLLNKEFRGRVFFRALYFLPVIIACGVVMNFLNGDKNQALSQISDSDAAYTLNAIDFNDVLEKLNFPTKVTELISEYIAMIFNLIWSCGVPITLFISGLQTIPPQLYEASTVEGANRWEEFWYITVPMLSHVLVLVIVYVSLDIFTVETNPIIKQAYTLMKNQAVFDSSSAMLWFYFLIAGTLTGGILALFYRFCMRRWQ